MIHKPGVIKGNTVMGLCTANEEQLCGMGMNVIAAIPTNLTVNFGNYYSLDSFLFYTNSFYRGKFQTSNIIMANWSRAMWQNVVNRAIRMLASGPFWIKLLGICHCLFIRPVFIAYSINKLADQMDDD
ncbi:hypothetical protein KIN20_014512 [Parelaphostrongylus tenuis]|uniref:Uncharacterized protein n=1 Tax=Parelaphostrongylus tenuis TaxID=148309 RepID=A0AAD5MW62_PARTN|nr:hypothetical protein KIN20_014512 [Parelaphostrongylus tenuis]